VNQVDPNAPDVQTPPGAVALLLLLFSTAAIAIKVVHHNPFADSAREITVEMTAVAVRRDKLLRGTGSALCAQETAMAEAEALLGSLVERAYRRLDEAMAAVLRERANHGMAGDQAPRFTTVAMAAGMADRIRLFDELPEPPVDLGPVLRARDELKRYNLPKARERAVQAERDLIAQTGAEQSAAV
jgi:hypothetical protein